VVSRTSLGGRPLSGFVGEEAMALLAAHDAGDALHMAEGL
jgi:hypothetical protein